MKTLQAAVMGSDAAEPMLPFVHSTSLFSFRKVVEQNLIATSECPVFSESLLYLFYGKPSYRVGAKSGSRTDISHCPICFVLNPAAISSVKRIFPFDSGAFSGGFYAPYLAKGMNLEGFFLDPRPDMPSKLVRLFFGSNRSYFLGEVSSNCSIGAMDFEMQSYHDLISSTGESCVDDRKASIELQLNQSIELSEETVVAVVLPQAALQDSDVFQAVNGKWKAVPITYETFKATSPTEYHGVIRQKLIEFFEIRSLI